MRPTSSLLVLPSVPVVLLSCWQRAPGSAGLACVSAGATALADGPALPRLLPQRSFRRFELPR